MKRAGGVVAAAAVLAMAAAAAVGQAQTAVAVLPDAPKPARDRVEVAGLAVVGVARVGDWLTTREMLRRGDHEVILPGWIAGNGGRLAAVEAGAWVADWLAGRELRRRGGRGRQWAKVITWADAAGVVACDLHNVQLGGVAAQAGGPGGGLPGRLPGRLPGKVR